LLIHTEQELTAFCEQLRTVNTICIDTEFAREGRYYSELGTIQIAAGDKLAVIDPFAIRNFSSLFELLVAPTIVKVFHAGYQDLEIFYRLLGRPVAPMFDTQIAAAFLGYGDQISLRSLLQITLGERLDKEHTFTDWLRRPLSDTQLAYALNDVRHLERLYELLNQSLHAEGRAEWAEEEFRLLEAADRFVQADERQAYVNLKGAERLSQPALGILQELAAWRELTARRLNVPPRKLVIDPVLIALALRPPTSMRQLAEVRGMNPRQIQEFGPEIIEAVRRGVLNRPPAIERDEAFPPSLEPTVDFLSLCMRTVARDASISAALLANRSDLRSLAISGDAAPVALLQGWRRQVIGTALLKALRGGVTASISAVNKEVQLQWQREGTDDTLVCVTATTS
jgi:ribonuclease D